MAETKRWLLVTEEISDLLDGTKLAPGGFPRVSAERLIGAYCAGYRVTVSRRMTNLRPEIEQIVGHDEVWAFCARSPIPGWRILGRFYLRNVFVALRPWDKHDLFGKYAAACNEVIADWKKLFGDYEPVRSTELGSYLSYTLRDYDDDDEKN